MKKSFLTISAALTIGMAIGVFASEGKANLYSGQGKGLIGDIKIAADFDGNKVSTVKVLEHLETPGVGGEALKKLVVSSIGKKVSEIDSIAGATYTSAGFKLALEDALNTKKTSN